MKKIILIPTIILIFIAVGIGVYFGWQKSKEILMPPSDNQQSTINNQQSPLTTPEPKLKIISDQPAFDYWIAVSGDIFYFNQQGQIFKVSEKEDELVSERKIDNLINIKADKNGAMVIIKYGDLNSPKLEIFDVSRKIWQPLADNIIAADFSPDSSKIIYLENKNNGANDLIIKDLGGVKPKTSKILSLTQIGFDLKWFSVEKVLLMPAPSAGYAGEIWQVDIKNKTLKSFASGFGLSIKWSADGDNSLLFDSSDNQLSLVDANGEAKANIGFTLPEKCFVNSVKIYCAVMQNYFNVLPKPVFPDDYLKKAFYSKDKIYVVDIISQSSEIILSDALPPAIDAVNLFLNGNNLLFINRYDNRVYSLAL